MKPRTVIIAGSWAHIGLVCLGLTAAALGIFCAASIAVQGVLDAAMSERQD